jgi:hypothetical protein
MGNPMRASTGVVCRKQGARSRLAIVFCVLLAAVPGQAVLFFSTGAPDYNTTAPTGTLANSGWQWEGSWGNFLGTAIAPQFFATARHVGGAVGDKFTLAGVEFVTTARFDDTGSDLTLWQVAGTFTDYADLFSTTNEPGQVLVVFGRGTQRGAPVNVQTAAGPQVRGWRWGAADGRQRWGQNQVESAVDGDDPQTFDSGSFGKLGSLLRVTFDQGGGTNEAHLSVGDSGGAVFIQDGPSWKLAGINLAVEGPYSLTNSGPGFDAAIFDQRQLYTEENDRWTRTKDSGTAQPGAFYATRISSHLDWIRSIVSSTGEAVPWIQSAAAPQGPYLDEPSAHLDLTAHTITIAVPGANRFYRIRANAALQLTGVRVSGTSLVFGYYQPWERRRV